MLRPAISIFAWIVVVVLVVGGCSQPRDTNSEQVSGPVITSPKHPVSGQWAPSVEQQAPEGATFSTAPGSEGDVVTANFDIHDNFTGGLRKIGAQKDTIDILRYAHNAYPKAAWVYVQGHFTVKDNYGNERDAIVLNVGYNRETLDKINFRAVDPDKIWAIRDRGMVHPDLQ